MIMMRMVVMVVVMMRAIASVPRAYVYYVLGPVLSLYTFCLM